MDESTKLRRTEIRANRDIKRSEANRDIILALVKNPVVDLIAGFVVVEALQRFPSDHPIIGNLQGDLIEAALAGIVSIQALAPSIPYIAQGTSDLLGAVGKVAPLALMGS